MPFDLNLVSKNIRIHPLAQPAFDLLANLVPFHGLGVPRAVRVDGELWVFAGFLGLGNLVNTVVETGLSDKQIEDAAWNEVRALMDILTMPTETVRRLSEDLVVSVPKGFWDGACPDAPRLMKRMRVKVQAKVIPARETGTIYDRALRRFEELRGEE